jgi:hypothetical protein
MGQSYAFIADRSSDGSAPIAAVALGLAVERAGRAAGDHAVEMQRHALWAHGDHIRLDRRIAWRQQKPKPRAIPDHDAASAKAACRACPSRKPWQRPAC